MCSDIFPRFTVGWVNGDEGRAGDGARPYDDHHIYSPVHQYRVAAWRAVLADGVGGAQLAPHYGPSP